MSVDVPATFLELCQRTASECSVSLTGPSDTTTQTGRLGQIVRWVQTSWIELATLHDDWLFLRSSFQVDTTAGDGEYAYGDCTDTVDSAVITSFRRWVGDRDEQGEVSMKAYLVSAGVATQSDLRFLDFRDFNQLYLIGSPSNSYPSNWTRAPNGKLLIGPKPDGIYRITGDYQKAAVPMADDDAEPPLPLEQRMAIVYRAMMKYGRYTGASEVYADGQSENRRIMAELRRTQRPRDLVGGQLA
jgi:hypothetical protein